MTTTALARTNGNAEVALANAPAPDDALARLAQWVEAARNAHALVAPLVDTAFVPEAYKPKVDPRADERVPQWSPSTGDGSRARQILAV